jgi:CubicO group peptidase (beta-lactamase class C family)
MNRRFLTFGIRLGIGLCLAVPARPAFPQGSEIVSGELGGAIDRYLGKAVANGYSGSVLAARGDAIILAKGYGWADREKKIRQTAETVFSIGSITKQFTGAAILILETAGKLNVGDPIGKYFEGVPADKAGITLHHLLTHTAGFVDALGDDYEPIGADAFAKRALESKLLFKPGERYEYSNVGFSLLGIIVEKVSGKGYEEYLREAIFLPSGMTRTGYLRPGFAKSDLAVGYRDGERWGSAMDRPWMPDGPGWHLRANGGILSTVGDMHRWFLALRKDAILSPAAKTKYFSPHVREYPDGDSYYGYGWVTQKTGRGTTLIWHNGGNGIYNAFMGFEPETGLAIVVSSNVAGKISDDYAQRILQIVLGEYRAIDESRLKEYAGTYRFGAGGEFTVRFDENDVLTAAYADKALVGLLAASGREDRKETSAYDERAASMVTGALKGDFAALAAAWGEPLEVVAKRASVYWGGKTARFGEVKNVEALGTVDRPRNLLTYVRVDFARRTQFFTCVWDKANGRLADLRESEILERPFEPRSETEFFSPAIGASIEFRRAPEGTVLVIRKDGAETTAKKK